MAFFEGNSTRIALETASMAAIEYLRQVRPFESLAREVAQAAVQCCVDLSVFETVDDFLRSRTGRTFRISVLLGPVSETWEDVILGRAERMIHQAVEVGLRAGGLSNSFADDLERKIAHLGIGGLRWIDKLRPLSFADTVCRFFPECAWRLRMDRAARAIRMAHDALIRQRAASLREAFLTRIDHVTPDKQGAPLVFAAALSVAGVRHRDDVLAATFLALDEAVLARASRRGARVLKRLARAWTRIAETNRWRTDRADVFDFIVARRLTGERWRAASISIAGQRTMFREDALPEMLVDTYPFLHIERLDPVRAVGGCRRSTAWLYVTRDDGLEIVPASKAMRLVRTPLFEGSRMRLLDRKP